MMMSAGCCSISSMCKLTGQFQNHLAILQLLKMHSPISELCIWLQIECNIACMITVKKYTTWRGAYSLRFNYLQAKHVRLEKGQRSSLAGDLVYGSVTGLPWGLLLVPCLPS